MLKKLFLLISIVLAFLSGCNSSEKIKAENEQQIFNEWSDTLKTHIDSLTWHVKYVFQGKGNKTLDSIDVNGPYRLAYVFQGGGNSSFTINREENGELTAPLLVLTSASSNSTVKNDSLKNATLKIINNGGRWSVSFASLNYKSPLNSDSIPASVFEKLSNLQDSLITSRIQSLDSIQPVSFENMQNGLQEWKFLANSDYIWHAEPIFNLPSTSLRFQIVLDIPEEKQYYDYMKNGVNGLDIELTNIASGRTIHVLNHRGRCGYFIYNKEISIPAGQYKIEYEGLGDIAFNVYVLQ